MSVDEFEKKFDTWYEDHGPMNDETLRGICFGAFCYGGDYWILGTDELIATGGEIPMTWEAAKRQMIDDNGYPFAIADGTAHSMLLSCLYDLYADENKTTCNYADELLTFVLEATEQGAFWGWKTAVEFYNECHNE